MGTHKLKFLNPLYHSGLNVTVRNGDKWYKQAEVGDDVKIYRVGDNTPLARGTIFHLQVYQDIYGIPPWLLQHEHDPACSNYVGLLFAMKRAYGEAWKGTLSPVTVIVFGI